MKAICFTLTGQTAFFKKPEVNTYFYFTFSHIHKISLLGIFGAILGYGGHRQIRDKQGTTLSSGFPEFYERLNTVSVSILPNNEKGYISKKVQTFNNSVGYASKEQGGNLIVREQWLEDPSWDIYILINSEESERLATAILESRCVYTPYLGKNDHFADILDPRIVELEENNFDHLKLHCLAPESAGKVVELDYDEIDETASYCYMEHLPIGMDSMTNQYLMEKFIFTATPFHQFNVPVYRDNDRNFLFY